MAHWILIPNPGKKMKSLMGPYSSFRAQQVADKLDVPYEIEPTISSNERKAKWELRELLIQKKGYAEGSGNIKQAVTTIEELGGREDSSDSQGEYKKLLHSRRPAHRHHGGES